MRRKLDLGLPLLYVAALLLAGFVLRNQTALGAVAVVGLAILALYYLALRPRRSA